MLLNLKKYTKEFRYNINLSYPVIIGLLGHTMVQFVDNVMVGQLGTAELAAVSLGNSFFFLAMALGIGLSTAITPLVAETDGMKNIIKGRNVFIHGLILCFLLGIFLSSSVLLSKPFLFQMGQPDEVAVLFALAKIGRTLEGEYNPDDYIDAVGYVAIAHELKSKREDELEYERSKDTK